MHRFVLIAALPLACASDPSDGGGTDTATDGGGTESTSDSAGTGGQAPTYWEDVAPITYANCVGCHRQGSIAPFSLLGYSETKLWGPAAAAATAARIMPPIPADASGACNTFTDIKWLTDDEIQTIQDWVDGGMLEGDPANGPDEPPPPDGLAGDLITLDPGVEYTAEAIDDYRCFVVDPGIDTMKYLTGFQVNPGEKSVVHHVIVYAPEDATAEGEAIALDEAEAGPGYTCFGGAEVSASTLAVWAPGLPPTDYPAGTGIAVEPNRKLVMQVHYNTAMGTLPDRTTVDVRLEDSVPKTGIMFLVANVGLALPPGEESVVTSAEEIVPNFPGSIEIWGAVPHMHELGRKLRVDLDGQCLIDVPQWDFNWQRMYFYEEPILLSGGETVEISCEYDTTSRDTPTYWGEGTQDEMCLSYVYVAY